MKSFLHSALFVLAIIASFNATAQINSLCLKGTVIYVDDQSNLLNGSILVGDSINGEIKYALNLPDDNSLSTVGDYNNTLKPSGIRVNIHNRIFQTDSANVNFLVETANDHYDRDNIVFRSYQNIFSPSIPDLDYETHIAWQLDDTNQTALNSTDIPTFITLSSWQQDFALTITGENWDGDKSIFIRANVTSVEVCEDVAAVKETQPVKSNLIIYPNPLSTFATIKFSTMVEDAELNITDGYGKSIFKASHISGDKMKIYRRDLAAGIYFVQVNKDDKTVMTGRLIVTE